jgi:hypothetical protein
MTARKTLSVAAVVVTVVAMPVLVEGAATVLVTEVLATLTEAESCITDNCRSLFTPLPMMPFPAA